MGTRLERVVLELQDEFTGPILSAAAAAKTLDHQLDDLSGRTVGASRSNDDLSRSSSKASRDVDRLGTSARKASRDVTDLGRSGDDGGAQIDKFSGRLRILLDMLALLGPGAVPITAVLIPALSGLASQFGFAALAGGTLIGSMQGIGDALDSINDYKADPTVANLEKVRASLKDLSPEARQFALELPAVIDRLKEIRDAGAENMLPGFSEAIDNLESLQPKIEAIVAAIGSELGGIAMQSSESLAGPRWEEFFDFLAAEAPGALNDMARATGNFGHAMAGLWMAFDPLNDDFGSFLVDSTAKLDRWANGLAQTDGFEEFVDYIRTNGPQVAETFGAIADAGLQIVEATAPLGGPVLEGLEAVAKVIAAIADSDLGTPLFTAAAGMALLSRGTAAWGSVSKTAFGQGVKGQYELAKNTPGIRDFGNALLYSAHSRETLTRAEQSGSNAAAAGATRALKARDAVTSWGRSMRPAAGYVAGLAAVSTGLSDKLGVTNAITLAMAGSMAGPWGTALGAGVGLMIDAKSAASDYAHALDEVNKSSDKGDLGRMQKGIQDFKKEVADNSEITGFKDFFGDTMKGLGMVWDQGFSALGRDDTGKLKEMLALSTDMETSFLRLGTSLGSFSTGVSYTGDEVAGVASRLVPFLDQLGVSGEDLAKMDGAELQELAGNLQTLMGAADSTEGRTESLKASLQALEDQTLSNAESSSQFATALAAMIGPGLEAESATDKHTDALRKMGDALKDNKRGFDGNSEAALTNREASRSWMSSLTEMLTAQAQAGAGSGEIARRVGEARAAFIQEGVAAGRSAETMRRRARAMGLTPKLVRTIFEAAGLEMVSAKVSRLNRAYQNLPNRVRVAISASGIPKTEGDLNRLDKKVGGLTRQQRRIVARLMDQTPGTQAKILRNLKKVDNAKPKAKATLEDKISPRIPGIQHSIDSLHGKTVTVYTEHKNKNARGGLYPTVRAYAAGDIANNHQPELAGPGTTRIWREPETGGEAYIPLANDYRRPRAWDILEQTASVLGGRVVKYAQGGLTKRDLVSGAREFAIGGFSASATGSVSVVFPSPQVMAQAVAGAEAIAISGAKYAASAQEIRQVGLDQLRQQQQIASIQKQLSEREDKVVGKGKHKKTLKGQGAYSVTGIDRTVAQAELKEAKIQLWEMRQQSAVQKQIADARAEALAAARQARTAAIDQYNLSADVFARPGAAGAVRSVEKTIADMAAAAGVIAELRSRGASPGLLLQMKNRIDQGDYVAVTKLGRAFLSKPELLTQINTGFGTLGSVSASLATLTNDPRFLSGGSWNPTAQTVKQVEVTLAADPSTWMSDLRRQVTHDVLASMNAGG